MTKNTEAHQFEPDENPKPEVAVKKNTETTIKKISIKRILRLRRRLLLRTSKRSRRLPRSSSWLV